MGVFYDTIPPSLQTWIKEQKVFWVATAPLSGQGHVNLSPKGGPYFGLVDDRTFWYMDLSGSGSETIAHLYEPGNGRVTVMFNAFDGPPKIVRLFGKGRVLERPSASFTNFLETHSVTPIPGTRSIILVDVHQVGSSCGFSVPYYTFDSFRPILNDHFAKKEARHAAGNEKESLERYWAFKNAWSVDRLPAMKRGLDVAEREGIQPVVKMKKNLVTTTTTKGREGSSDGGGIGSSFLAGIGIGGGGGGLGTVILVALLGFALGLAVAVHGGPSVMTRWSGLVEHHGGAAAAGGGGYIPRAYQSGVFGGG